MGDQQQGRAEPGAFLEQAIDHQAAGRPVEIAGRFVGQQQHRAGDKGARDRHSLLLAAGQLPGIMAKAVPEPDPRERRPGRRHRTLGAGQLQGDRHIFEGGHRRQQVECLTDDADMAAAQPRQRVLVEPAEIMPGHDDPPAASGVRAPRATIRRLDLPRPRWADQGHRLARLDGERDAAQDRRPARQRSPGSARHLRRGPEASRAEPEASFAGIKLWSGKGPDDMAQRRRFSIEATS